MKPILNIENLTKIYGNVPSQTKALNGITFQVMPGEFARRHYILKQWFR